MTLVLDHTCIAKATILVLVVCINHIELMKILTKVSSYFILNDFNMLLQMQIIMPSNQMMADNQWWNRSQGAQSAVCCFWFKDINQAKRWFESAGRIKQPDFPNSNPYQAVAVPLTYGHKATLPFGPKRMHAFVFNI